jgi:hypothetical protein
VPAIERWYVISMESSTSHPRVVEVPLSRHYQFMYENFAVLTQGRAYLLLEKQGDTLFALRFDGNNCRYGGPNDEAHSAHPLAKFGLGFYGLYEVHESPWIRERMVANRVHPQHNDSMFDGLKHYIACFKDVKFECICREMSEVQLTSDEFNAIVAEQVRYLE